MNFKIIGQLAGAVVLAVGLAGCMDVTMDVEIQSETNGKATTTMTMGADFYAMAKAGMASEGAEGGFCDEEGAVLTENEDGSATCVMVSEGSYDQLKTGESDDGAKFEVVGPGLVKATFSTAEMSGEVAGGEEQDEETKAMMQAFFEGHFITLRVTGNEIVESNMTIADDKKSADVKIPFLDLINKTAELPAELYAVVKTN
jgi:hypothetical protein